jgi:hypothetical protein
MLDDRAQDEAADAAEAVDGDAKGHGQAPEARVFCRWRFNGALARRDQPQARNIA